MILWHANLGRGVDRYVFEREFRKVYAAAGPRAVICLQEIDEADAPEEMEIISRITRNTHVIIGANTAIPILVPRQFLILGERQTLAAKGLAKFSPARPINEVLLQLRPDLKVVVFNTHLPIDRLQTLTRRLQVRRKLRARARARLLQMFGGVWAADTNTHRGWPTIVRGETTVINAGIDKSKAWAPPGYHVEVSDRQQVDLTIDGHDAHGARVRFIKEKAA
jgi:hypothetical protein